MYIRRSTRVQDCNNHRSGTIFIARYLRVRRYVSTAPLQARLSNRYLFKTSLVTLSRFSYINSVKRLLREHGCVTEAMQ